jgi:hypothetical protein
MFEATENGIILQQMRQRFGIGKVVRRDKFDLRIAQPGADHITTDPAEAVDPHFYRHISHFTVKNPIPCKSSMAW